MNRILGIAAVLALASSAEAAPAARLFSPRNGIERREIRVGADGVAVPLSWLESAFSLETKRLPSGETVLCRGETCVPLPPAVPPPSDAEGGERFVALAPIAAALGATLVFDAETNDLLLDVPATPSPESPEPKGLGAPLELVLPDLAGRETALSSFRGKRVILFAWASW